MSGAARAAITRIELPCGQRWTLIVRLRAHCVADLDELLSDRTDRPLGRNLWQRQRILSRPGAGR